MRKIILLLIVCLLIPTVVHADDYDMFMEHGSIMLIIDPDTGAIAFANLAAANFYGCGLEQLLKMNISDINMLSDLELQQEMSLARIEHRNYFNFTHKLCDNTLREVEVYSYPIEFKGKEMLFSIIFDVTESNKNARELQKRNLEKEKLLMSFIYGISIILFIFGILIVIILKSNERLKYLSKFDHLTGVFNRRQARQQFVRLQHHHKKLAFYMIDVNNLKFINDTYGHIVGDEMIVKVAKKLSSFAKGHDFVSRVSGDEFIMVLSDLSYDQADKIEETIKNLRISLKDIDFSVSIGCMPIDGLVDYDVAFSVSESRMYNNKTLGKPERNKAILKALNTKSKQMMPDFDKKTHFTKEIAGYFATRLSMKEEDKIDLFDAIDYQEISHTTTSKSDLSVYNHPEKGYAILNALGVKYNVSHIVFTHHEHFDGSGYPKGLRGENIPLSSRIISICNSLYDNQNLGDGQSIIYSLAEVNKTWYDPELLELIKEKEFMNFLEDLL